MNTKITPAGLSKIESRIPYDEIVVDCSKSEVMFFNNSVHVGSIMLRSSVDRYTTITIKDIHGYLDVHGV